MQSTPLLFTLICTEVRFPVCNVHRMNKKSEILHVQVNGPFPWGVRGEAGAGQTEAPGKNQENETKYWCNMLEVKLYRLCKLLKSHLLALVINFACSEHVSS